MQKVAEFLEKLIKEADGLLERAQLTLIGPYFLEFTREYTRWLRSCQGVLRHAGLNEYAEQVGHISQDDSSRSYNIAEIAGVLETARDMLVNRFVGDVRYLVHAEFFDSLLGQAQELFETQHLTPSAVVARIVLERWLRDQAGRASIENAETEKAAILNDTLKKMKVFSVPKWRQVQACLDVGNAAAHGKDTEFTADDVRRFLDFARVNCV